MDGSAKGNEVSSMRLKLFHNHPQGLRITTHHKTQSDSDTCITVNSSVWFTVRLTKAWKKIEDE